VSRSRLRPEFFVDRSLGRHQVPDGLREAGWTLRTHHWFAVVFGQIPEACAAVLLECAFRGELVPQDPSDEPAEALLARIRAGRGLST